MISLTLTRLPGHFAICALPPLSALPIPTESVLWSLTVTVDEISLICPWNERPENAAESGPWVAFAIEGPLDPSLTGVLSVLLQPLAEAKIAIFAVSTHGTDVILVPGDDATRAGEILLGAGHVNCS